MNVGPRPSIPDARGTQSLVAVSTMESALARLPTDAATPLLVLSPSTPGVVERKLRGNGLSVNDCGHIPVTGSPVRYDGPLWTGERVDPSDLTGLSMEFSRALPHVEAGNGWLLFDDVQLLLLYAAEKRVFQLLTRMLGHARTRDVTGVYGIATDTVSEQTLATLRVPFDEYVERGVEPDPGTSEAVASAKRD